ncbi:LacI family DNA-binding transcriptional regulator [Paraglaciecola aquimarina]|uniref:LacI family DNA-binding transcriptional regulator n=1 Tax=Paraglaciecola algarum TaxID=3050085 RepID=A0ABS9D9F5_9ALTE|nr:LacI family DNA-binding transcriptional regulator [Paraglaciecola sp. G1-23]
MVTVKDVAKVAGVSTATVSRVLNGQGKVGEQCRARVTKVIKELGYKVSSKKTASVSNNTQIIGLVTPKISMAFFGLLAAGAEQTARELGSNLMICNTLYDKDSEINSIQSLIKQGCKSIILHSEYTDSDELVALSKDIPGLVLINRFIPEISERCVWFDNISSAQQGANYVLDQGHKDIALISSIYQNGDPSARLMGTKQALLLRGINLGDERIFEAAANIEGGIEATNELIQSGKPFSAIIAFNDLMAIGAMHALNKANIKVPEQVSVLGFDDLPISRAAMPQLTTMSYPIEDMAKYAVNLSLSLIEDKPQHAKQTHLFLSELVKRDTISKKIQ